MNVWAVGHLILLLNWGTRLSNENDLTEVTVRWRDRPKWWLVCCEQCGVLGLTLHCLRVYHQNFGEIFCLHLQRWRCYKMNPVHSIKMFLITYQTSAISSYQYNFKSRHVHSQYRGIYGPTMRHTWGKAVNCISALCVVLSCWAVYTRYMWSTLIRSTAARQKKWFSRRYDSRCPLQLATWWGGEYFWFTHSLTHTHTHTHTHGTQCIHVRVCHSMY